MDKLKKTLIAACSLVLAGVSTSVLAGSDNFAGPYIGLSIAGYGLGVDGSSSSVKSGTDAVHEAGKDPSTDLQIGKIAGVAGIEAGYALPLGDSFLIDVGAAYLGGEAKLDYNSDDVLSAAANVSLLIDDLITYYIAPTIVISDTASVYVKLGLSEADIGTQGDVTAVAGGKLSGQTWGIGTRVVLPSGLFIKSEAGFTDYNAISSHGKGNDQASSTTYSADPQTAYGQFSMGFRF